MLTHKLRQAQVKKHVDTSNNTTSGSAEKRGHPRSVRILWVVLALLLFLLGVLAPAQAGTTPKLFQTCLIYYGDLTTAQIPTIAQYDLADLQRLSYTLVTNAWSQIKVHNPGILLYLYEMGSEMGSGNDSQSAAYLNELGRYNVSRGHPMGSINGNNPAFFLLGSSGKRLVDSGYSTSTSTEYFLDFGSPTYQQYWVIAVQNDIVAQQWAADGVFVDGCGTTQTGSIYTGSNAPAKYPNDAAWVPASNAFSAAISEGMAGFNQKVFLNRGNTTTAAGIAGWVALDAMTTPPDAVLEEGAFVVAWGSGAANFYSESEWKGEIDLMSQIHHSKVVYESHCNLAEGASGTDNYGKSVGFWDAYWYAMCSYLIGKNTVDNNSYFAWMLNDTYTSLFWMNELTPGAINLGNADGNYQITSYGGTNVYWRKFDNGYVYVNPTGNNVTSVPLPVAGKPLNHSNFTLALSSIADVTSISLPAHRAVIVMNDPTTSPTITTGPTVPANVQTTVVSSSQINLTWTASTDSAGVTGYNIYREGVQVGTATATSYKNTGLSANTTYMYSVSAYDAAGNQSAQSTQVSATTDPASTNRKRR